MRTWDHHGDAVLHGGGDSAASRWPSVTFGVTAAVTFGVCWGMGAPGNKWHPR